MHYKQLVVWQKSMELAQEIYRLMPLLPKEELYALSSQMRRSAVSIPSNIAEGQVRSSTNDYLHFLSIAQGSRAELETQLLLCAKIGFLSSEQISNALSLSYEVGRMLAGIIAKLKIRD